MMEKSPESTPEEHSLIGQSVNTLAELHAKGEQEANRHQRFIETLTGGLGQPRALYVLLFAVLLWTAYNLLEPWLQLPRLDPPPFYWLQGVVGFMALLLTSMVLITQQRQGKVAARRALLDLHVNLLAEQKVTKLIALLEELRRDLPSVSNRHDPQAEAMTRPVDPQATLDKLEAQIAQAIAGPPIQDPKPDLVERLEEEEIRALRKARDFLE